ncbi:DivIVA domain-containing protein [Actinocorallia sp. A-T 12471]|uniref:DivIVA domain-containing protein n=1 Tax=Actinocorallia sp. A-T 12471 TaxID=3089813 RepID=UPI0029CC457F|nr:DivIVA domain-containing protein [Actinocorallia sp. A-T 12471]MDX6744352.1 DivIVA domain-containing protein [Actinocorallia sp. A-T 12471]
MTIEQDTHAAIAELTRQVAALRDELAEAIAVTRPRHRAMPHRLTAETVRNTVFVTTRMKPGYHAPDVDDFLDRVEAEITQLTHERDTARTELEQLRETTLRP